MKLEGLGGRRPDQAEAEAEGPDAPPPLRTHLVIGIRKEWYADLARRLRIGIPIDDATYHLAPLRRDAARQAAQVPAELAGQPFPPGTVDTILADLEEEDGIQPVLLSVVCRGAFAAQQRGERAASAHVDDVLDRHVDEVLAGMTLLGELVGAGGVRVFVTAEQLVGGRLRARARRERLLARHLLPGALIRQDRWHGEPVYDIVHERLSAAVLRAPDRIRAREPGGEMARAVSELAEFRAAVAILAVSDATVRPVTWAQASVLMRGRARLDWDGLSASLLLRGLLREERLPEEWTQLLAHFGPAPASEAALLAEVAHLAARPAPPDLAARRALGWWFDEDEIAAALAGGGGRDEAGRQFLLRSALVGSREALLRLAPGLLRLFDAAHPSVEEG